VGEIQGRRTQKAQNREEKSVEKGQKQVGGIHGNDGQGEKDVQENFKGSHKRY
jgi:hypothetical protein